MGKVYLLVFHQAINAPSLNHYLLCLMQCWLHYFQINEIPKFLVDEADESTHAIVVDDPSGEEDPLIIPLMLNGTTSYFPVRYPTSQST